MLDAVKVLFLLTGASSYLGKLEAQVIKSNSFLFKVTKFVRIGTSEREMGDASEIVREFNEEKIFETLYEVMVEEEDQDLPKRLLHIKALAKGQQLRSDIMFLLSGDGVEDDCPENSSFAINAFTGELFLIRTLDRDPPNGRALFELNITAEDDFGRKLEGMARVRVRVRDVNDNCPQFDKSNYSATVQENNEAGVELMRVTALDSDQGDIIRYAIEMNKVDGRGHLMFEVNELSGQLNVAVCCLDREDIGIYTIKVCASDGKHKACCQVTIVVTDLNDNRPQFTRKNVIVELGSSELRAGRVVTNVSVVDLDLLATNQFTFSVVPSQISNHFQIVPTSDVRVALLVISNDFQTVSEISISVSVSDSDDSGVDFCYITIRVLNDTTSEQTVNSSDFELTTIGSTSVTNITESVPQKRDVIDKRISVLVFVSGLALSLIIALLVRRRPQTEETFNDFCSLRNYDSEGGETQNWTFDLSQLRVPETNLLPDVCHKKF